MLFRSKEKILQQLLQKEEEITKLNKTALSLKNHIESHTCTFVFPSGNEDPVAKISQLTTKLKMAERDRKKAQADLETESQGGGSQ